MQNLGMLGSKPAAFASTAQRVAAVQSTALHSSSAQRQSKVMESLWHICTRNVLASPPSPAPQAAEAAPLQAAEAAPPQAAEATLAESAAYADLQQDLKSSVVPEEQNQVNSSDLLLNESIDAWQQLVSSTSKPEASQNSPNPAQAFFEGVSDAHATGCSLHEDTAALGRHSHANHSKSGMQGVSLQQLLSFVQLVQQQTSNSVSAASTLPAFKDLSPQQCAELDRLARMCSENKQANMAYVGIGNRKHFPLGSSGHSRGTGHQASAVQPVRLKRLGSPDGITDSKWHPQGVCLHDLA